MTVLPPQTDRWISEEFERLAEIIQDYDHHLELRWIPPELRTTPEDEQKAFCVVDARSNYIVMYFAAVASPVDVLSKLFQIDNKNGNVLDKMMAENNAQRIFDIKRQMDQQEEARDFSLFALKNEKNVWKHNGVKFDSEMRRID